MNYINADYTLTLSRLPDGEYIGAAALTHYSNAGVATGTAALFDRLGPIGAGVATGLANPGFRPAEARLARLQDDHRDVPVGPGLVCVEIGVGLDHFGHSRAFSSGPATTARTARLSRPLSMCTSGSATRLWYHCGFSSRPPIDATTTTSSSSVMYTKGEANILPDLRPRCSSSSVGTGFFAPAPIRQFAPIFPPLRRYSQACARPAYLIAVLTNGAFSCLGFLFASIGST